MTKLQKNYTVKNQINALIEQKKLRRSNRSLLSLLKNNKKQQCKPHPRLSNHSLNLLSSFILQFRVSVLIVIVWPKLLKNKGLIKYLLLHQLNKLKSMKERNHVILHLKHNPISKQHRYPHKISKNQKELKNL